MIDKFHIEVLLPLAVPKQVSYHVEVIDQKDIKIGKRVEVQFGHRRRYAGLIVGLDPEIPINIKTKAIIQVLDKEPIIHSFQIKFWKWISNYYCCTLGEVMQAALPSALKLNSETKILINPAYELDSIHLSDDAFLIVEALTIQNELSLTEVSEITSLKNVYALIKELFSSGVILVKEELKQKYKPKMIDLIEWHEDFEDYSEMVLQALELVKNAKKQTDTLLAYIQLSKQNEFVKKKELYDKAGINSAVLNVMIKKGILITKSVPLRSLYQNEALINIDHQLNPLQEEAFNAIKKSWNTKTVSLLHGITGSGKTHIYIQLIREILEKKLGQVLYLLPEIALTTQLTVRLKEVFGNKLKVYHSGLSDRERVGIWKSVMEGHEIILGARSSIFLPFRDLNLVIIDESHDGSYKQVNPAPRYNARDAAIYLATLYGAKVLLGSATPSLESNYNALKGKYALIKLMERHGGVALPEISIIDMKEARTKKQVKEDLSLALLEEIEKMMLAKKQVLILKNRRGFAPIVSCQLCGWTAECKRCDVSLTYHRYYDQMRCHYCGYKDKTIQSCPSCGYHDLKHKGYGTEKLQEDLQIIFSDLRIGRMDYDTAKSRIAQSRIIEAFEAREYDILVGTQMISKGLDFDNIGLVAVLGADQILHYPHFRCNERAFQLLTQVSGRAGRKKEKGKVLIQSSQTQHPILYDVINDQYDAFYHREMGERKDFLYPPFYKMIQLSFLHKKQETSIKSAQMAQEILSSKYGNRIIGPTIGGIPKIRLQYITQIIIKLEPKPGVINNIKSSLMALGGKIKRNKGFSQVRINIDVDPN